MVRNALVLLRWWYDMSNSRTRIQIWTFIKIALWICRYSWFENILAKSTTRLLYNNKIYTIHTNTVKRIAAKYRVYTVMRTSKQKISNCCKISEHNLLPLKSLQNALVHIHAWKCQAKMEFCYFLNRIFILFDNQVFN